MLNKELLYATIQKFGVEIDDNAFERLDKYAEMLVETNKSFNLTAITEPDDVTVKHFADCLALFGKVDVPENAKLIDVGTGAGFPGLVLLLTRPDIKMTFLDSTKKKLGFIQNVLDETGIKAEVVHARAEEAGQNPQYREKYDFATARAVANLTNLSEYCGALARRRPLQVACNAFFRHFGGIYYRQKVGTRQVFEMGGGCAASYRQSALSLDAS